MQKRRRNILPLLLIILVAACLRFYNLLWGSPYFFNPDERNMATAISQFRFEGCLESFIEAGKSWLEDGSWRMEAGKEARNSKLDISNVQHQASSQASSFNPQASHCNLNPHFFAYGHFPLYLAFFSGLLIRSDPFQLSFPTAIFWLRFWSAVASTLTIPLVYLIVKQILKSSEGFFERNRLNGLEETQNLRSSHLFERRSDYGTLTASTVNREKIAERANFRGDSSMSTVLSLMAALLVAFTPGLIQAAHMGTTESLLTLFYISIIYLSFKLLDEGRTQSSSKGRLLLILIVIFGLAVSTKITAAVFIVPVILTLMMRLFSRLFHLIQYRSTIPLWPIKLLIAPISMLSGLIVIIAGAIILVIMTSPFTIIDLSDFMNITRYEIGVAQGNTQVFYTRQFLGATPVLFQMDKIFPYALGPVQFALGISGLAYLILIIVIRVISAIKNRSPQLPTHTLQLFILLASFFVYFLPNAFLFTKWTRFMIPIFPLFSIFAVFFLSKLYKGWIIGLLVIFSLLPGAAFISIYTHEDVRFTASRWIYENIPSGSAVLSETANVIDIPFQVPNLQPSTFNPPPISFDFYHLEENKELQDSLINYLSTSKYIFVPSRRLFANVMRLPDRFPITNRYYQALFSGTLGFTEVARFTSFPKFEFRVGGPSGDFEFPDENAEETWTVFDHPVIRIYKKVINRSPEVYRALLEIK